MYPITIFHFVEINTPGGSTYWIAIIVILALTMFFPIYCNVKINQDKPALY